MKQVLFTHHPSIIVIGWAFSGKMPPISNVSKAFQLGKTETDRINIRSISWVHLPGTLYQTVFDGSLVNHNCGDAGRLSKESAFVSFP